MADGGISFGPFIFDRARMTLARDGRSVLLGGRGATILQVLLEAEGRAVGKSELMDRVWPGQVVEEGNVSVQVAGLRKALGARNDGVDWIVTVPRVGYRLIADQQAPAREAPSGRLPIVAVLPFENLSGDPSQDYFADGVVDDLITALSNFRQFAVISRNSAFQYKGRAVDIRTVAAELGARYVLEGSVRRGGNRLRIAARLGDGETGGQLRGHTFDGTVEDIFDVQDHISDHVVGQIVPEIRKAEIEHSRRKRPGNLDAYDLVLRALTKLYSGDHLLNVEGYELCRRAIALEPDYALALSIAAWLLHNRVILGLPSLSDDDRANCVALNRRAEQLADGNPDILITCANTLIQVGR